MPTPSTREILEAASRYVILKTGHGITVGLHINDQHYGEAHSPANDLDAAVHAAYDNAKAHRRRGRGKNRARRVPTPAPTKRRRHPATTPPQLALRGSQTKPAKQEGRAVG